MGKMSMKAAASSSKSAANKPVVKKDAKPAPPSKKQDTLAGNKMTKLLDRDLIKYFEKLAEHYGISQVARGDAKAKTTDKGFLEVYTKNGDAGKLETIPVKTSKPNGANWKQTRDNRVSAKLGQMVKMKIPWFHESGKLEGLPTKMHTILIMWAYSPYVSQLEGIRGKKLLQKL
ncbi:unnamed protein product [Amoebophrya sp. A120]|nr:unnamed protein product [Amoebophrya sp. A120]|eukprot:GSA120T00011099001.1